MTTFRDPVLGKLEHSDDVWTGKAMVPLVNRRVTLYVWSDDPPGDRERTTWTRFCSEFTRDRWPDAVSALLRSAQSQIKRWRARPEEIVDIEKLLASPEKFARTLKCTSASLGEDERRRYVSLEFDTPFDIEHGLSLHCVIGRKRFLAGPGGEGPDFSRR